MHIANTGQVELLNAPNNIEAWEEIVRLNCMHNDTTEYSSYLTALKSYALLINDFITIKAHIGKLTLPVFDGSKVNMESVAYLEKKGYKIDFSSKENYIESLKAADKKRSNLMTRINMRRKEIEKLTANNKPGEQKGLEQILAALSFQLGYTVEDNITLARYNEYNKILKQKAEAHGRNK